MHVDNVMVVGANNVDGGGEVDFYWGIHGGYHGVCVEIFHGDDEVGKFCGCVFAKMG